MVVALHDERKRQRPRRIERRRRLADPVAPCRGLVEYEGEPFVESACGIERRQGRLDVRRARAHRNQAQIGCAHAAQRHHIVRGRGVDDRQRKAVAPKAADRVLDLGAAAGALDARFCIGATPAPTGERALRVGLDHADPLAVLHGGDREPDSEGALAAAALLGCQHDCVHMRRPSVADRPAPSNFKCASGHDQRVFDSSQGNAAFPTRDADYKVAMCGPVRSDAAARGHCGGHPHLLLWPRDQYRVTIMKLPRRGFLRLAGAAAATPTVARLAWAQSRAGQPYPVRPVRLVVGFPPGGGVDLTARLLAQALTERLGQSFFVENRPGAGSNLATETVVHAAPDGYTLLVFDAPPATNAT